MTWLSRPHSLSEPFVPGTRGGKLNSLACEQCPGTKYIFTHKYEYICIYNAATKAALYIYLFTYQSINQSIYLYLYLYLFYIYDVAFKAALAIWTICARHEGRQAELAGVRAVPRYI